MLSGCSDLRQTVGIDRTGPDEFAGRVAGAADDPARFRPAPAAAPGAARPQEVTAAEQARKVIDTAGPGEPGKQASAGLRSPRGRAAPRRMRPDPSQQVGDRSLSNKLLGYGGDQSGAGGREARNDDPEGCLLTELMGRCNAA